MTSGISGGDKASIIIAILSGFTVVFAWIFRYRIASMGKNRAKTPNEVLFQGYEQLLKSYQVAIAERDTKFSKLEKEFDTLQADMDEARETIRQMKKEDERKASVINDLTYRLQQLKTTAGNA